MGKEQANIPGKKRKAMVVVAWEPPQGGDTLVLLLKRPKAEAGYLWQPVTGNLEAGESFVDGALREASEETGLAFTGAPQSLGIRHEYEGRWGHAEEQAFRLQVRGESPPTPRLDPKEHDDFAWLSPQEAIARVPFSQQQEAILRASFHLTPLQLSREGVWRQDGEEITHERTIQLLHRSLARARNVAGKPREGFVARVGADELPVEIEDCPYFVSQVDLAGETIALIDGRPAALDPATLAIGHANVLYCTVAGERARFLRSAYYEIAKRIEPDGRGGFALLWAGRRHPILPLA